MAQGTNEASYMGAGNHQAEIHTNNVLIEVGRKRARQRFLGYTPEHDDAHGIEHLLDVMDERLSDGLHNAGNAAELREELVHQAAMIVAVIETIDRMEKK